MGPASHYSEHTLITQARLIELFTYDGASGILSWRRHQNGTRKGAKVGWVCDSGHLSVQISGRKYAIHRVIWCYVSGDWPAAHIDHINGDPQDNRFENLRLASRNINAQNQRKPHKQNRSGMLGASPAGGRYRAVLSVSGKQRHLGVFDTAEEAHAAYVEAKRLMHPGCTL